MKNNKVYAITKGQMVWLDAQNLKTNYHKKMAPKTGRTIQNIEVLGPLTYNWNYQTHGNSQCFPCSLLMPYTETDVHGPILSDSPDIKKQRRTI